MKSILLVPLLFLAYGVPGCSRGNDGNIEASGTVEGTDINVAAEVAGKVREVRVDEGRRVAVGDTLVVVDDDEYQIQLRQAMANARSFDATYRLAVEGSRREDIVQAEAAYRTAASDHERMIGLLESKTVTQKQYDDAYARFVAAEQTYKKLMSGSRKEEIAAAKARAEYAASQVDFLKKKIENCSILAPAQGTVTLRAVEPGEYVGVGASVVRLTYLERVKLMIYVGESDLGKVKLGQPAKVTIDSDPNRVFPGRVVYISPVAEFTPKNVQTKEERTKLVFGVKIEVENPDGSLKPGLPADAVIEVVGSEG